MIHLQASLCAFIICILVYWQCWWLRKLTSLECLLKLKLDHEHTVVLAIFLYWSLHCLLSFRFLAWPSPWHSSSRFTGLAKNMMPKASETLSHQPFCLIIKMNKRRDCKEYQAKPCWVNPSHCLIYFVVTCTDIITTCCLIHIFLCFIFAIYLPKRGGKAPEQMIF